MTSPCNILIRTAGGIAPKKELGFGHIYRSCNLAKNLKNQNFFFLIDNYDKAFELIKSYGFKKIFKIQKNLTVNNDYLKTKKIIEKEKIHLLIIDKYNLKKSYVKKLKKIVKIIVISDLYETNYDSDILINGFIGFPNQKIKKNNSTYFLGPNYQLINSNFLKLKKTKKLFDLLITFGGNDENDIILTFLQSIEPLISKMKIKIILGPGTKKTKQIRKYEKLYRNNLVIVQKTNNMSNEIQKSKFGLCSGGITSYEFAACRVPFGIISQVEHQLITAKIWDTKRIGKNLGLINNKTPSKIVNYIEQVVLSNNYSQTPKIIDGKAIHRISKIIHSELFNNDYM